MLTLANLEFSISIMIQLLQFSSGHNTAGTLVEH